jgi:hypothetical protein
MPGAAPSTRRCTSPACVHLTAALSRCDPQTRWRCIRGGRRRSAARLRSRSAPASHPDRRAAQIYALARRTRTSPRRLGRQGDRSTQPIWRHDASTFQAVGGSTTQLAAEAVVRAARALKRGRRSMSKSKQSVTAVRHSRRVTLAPCSPWVEGAADAVVGLQDRSEQAPLARSRRCLRRASPVDRRISDGDRLRTVGEPDPCTRTSRRTRGTTT